MNGLAHIVIARIIRLYYATSSLHNMSYESVPLLIHTTPVKYHSSESQPIDS